MSLNAKFLADFQDFYAACQKAELSLKGFETGAGKVETSLNKMANSLSGTKMIQDAALMATAVDKIGGVSALTASQLQKFGAQAAEAIAKMQATGIKDIPPNLQAIADAAKNAETSTGSLGTSFTQLVAGFVSAQAIISLVKTGFRDFVGAISASVTAAGDAEKAHTQMVAALRAQGTAIPSVISAYQGYATALQRTTIFQDDAIEGSIALMVQIGNVMPRDMEKALQATTNLASGLGIDLETAVRMVSKAAEGNVTALKKAGVVLDETTAKGGDFGKVLDEVNKKFGGQAEALAGTYQGRIAQLGNTWNNVEESIGRVITQNATLLTAFADINGIIDKNTGELKDNQTATNFVSDAVILTIRAFAEFASALDTLQTLGAGFIIGMRTVASAIGDVGIVALEAASGLALLRGDLTGYQAGQAAISSLKSAVDELGKRNDDTTKSSINVGNALQSMSAKADQLAAQLAKTRGQTIALKDAADGSADAWDKPTKAILPATEAQKKFEAALKEVQSAGEGYLGTLETINGSTVEAVKYYLEAGVSQEALASFYGLTATQIKAIVTDQKNYNDGTKEMERINAELFKAGNEGWKGLGEFSAQAIQRQVDGIKALNAAHDIEHAMALQGLVIIQDTTGAIAKQNGAVAEAVKKHVDLGTVLGDLSKAFTELAQVSGGSFKGVLQELAKVTAEGHLLDTATKDYGKTAQGSWAQATAAVNVYLAAVTLVFKAVDYLNAHTSGGANLAAAEQFQVNPGQVTAFINAQGGYQQALHDSGLSAQEFQRDIQNAMMARTPEALASALEVLSTAINHVAIQAAHMTSMLQAMSPIVTSNFNAMAVALEGDQASLAALGATAMTTLAAEMAAGKSFTEALADVRPGLAALEQSYKDLGLTIADAGLRSLVLQSDLATANPNLVAGIAGLTGEFKDLFAINGMNADQFANMETIGESMYSRLQSSVAALGGDTKDALLPMQDYLHQAESAAIRLGVPLDDNTQRMIDQSKELGIWHAVGATTMDPLIKALNDLVQVLEGVSQSSIDAKNNILAMINANVDPGLLAGKQEGGGATKPVGTTFPGFSGASTGGIVVPRGIEHFTAGGNVLQGPWGQSAPGGDDMLAFVRHDEMILNTNQQNAIGALLRSGGSGSGGGDTVVTTNLVVDGQTLARLVERHQTRDLQRRRKLPAA